MKLFSQKNLKIPKMISLVAMMPQLQEKKAQQYSALALTLVTLSFFGLFAINPTINTITDLQKQLSDDMFVSQQLQQKIANLSSLQQQYTKIQPDLLYAYTAVPTSPLFSEFVGQMQAEAQINNVTVTSLQTFPVDVTATTPTKYTSFAFSFEVEGTYQQVMTFLNALNNFPRSITFDSMSITRGSTVQQNFTASVRGKAYFQQN